ncbi:MAG: hypothetical protein M3042_07850 [Actinomycetota bacterium]|nr:hypothetical protein [Actinomycetota bacterium]
MTHDDDGRAMIEFVFLGVLTLVPLLYLVVAVFQVERNVFAVTQAAREAGRAYATAADPASAERRASYAADLALRDQGLGSSGVSLRYLPVSASCGSAAAGAQTLAPGAEFAVCVTRTVQLPGVPGYLAGRRNTVTGRYVVHIDDFRVSR